MIIVLCIGINKRTLQRKFSQSFGGEVTIVQDEAIIGDTTVWFEYKMNCL
jgi:hypothetical protein